MNRIVLAMLLCVFGFSNLALVAQEKSKSEEKADVKREVTPLRVQVVIAEYDGERKLSSLPYSLLVNSETPSGGRVSAIRMGLRVPIATSANQCQYQDVGTNLDGWATKIDDGRFNLRLSIERSSTYSPTAGRLPESAGGNGGLANQPVIQQFKTQLDVLIRDGQTIQSTMATDPVSGRVTKVEVTVSVLK